MADFTVGVSLQTNTYNSLGPGISASTTVPFSGINSYDFTGVTPGANAVYVPNFGRECWGYNDFTLEAFVRGDGTTAEGNILYLPFNEGGDIDEYGRRMLCGINSSSQIIIQNSFRSNTGFNRGVILIDIDTPNPSTWYHLAIVRKNNKLYVLWNGERVAYDIDSAGNGSFLDGGSISDIEGLGFLFKPFGGIDSSYPSRSTHFILGTAISSFPNFDGYIANYRSSYIAQYGVTSSTYTVPTSAFVGDESGTAYYAKTFSGTGQNNAGTALPQAGINSTVVIQPEATVALNTVSVVTVLDPVQVTGVSASTSLGDLVPDSEVIGVSLQAGEGRLGTGATTVTSPIPFAGLRSINCGNQSQGYSLYLPFQENDYSFYNDFTIETFLRGDGTTNDGGFISVDISNGLNNADDLNLYIDGNELQLNNYTFPGSGYVKKIGVDIGSRTTTDWYHFALVRKNNKLSMFWNGERVVHNVDSAGNGTADYIDITSNDAYLFEPFGGNNANNQGRAYLTYFGFGGNSVSGGTNKRWGGYLANCRTSYIAQYDPDISTLEMPTAPFDDDASGQSYYYKDETTFAQLNSSTTLPSSFNDLNFTAALGSITTEIGVLGEANSSLLQSLEGNVNVQLLLDPVPVTGQNLNTALGTAAAGPGVFAPVTGQNLTISLGEVITPIVWSNVSTGTTSTWIPVDIGQKAFGP